MKQSTKDLFFIFVLAAIAALFLWSAGADAQDDLRAVPVSEGEKAPFGGMLMTIDLATSLGVKVERCEAVRKLELRYQEQRCMLDAKKLLELHDIRERALSSKLDAAMKRVKELEKIKKPFWEEPALVASVGVVTGLAIGFGAVWAAAQLGP